MPSLARPSRSINAADVVNAEATDAENWANYTQRQAEYVEKDENEALLCCRPS